MTDNTATTLRFEDIIAPVAPEVFFAEFYDKRPRQFDGALAEGPEFLSWSGLASLLQKSTIWTSYTIRLVRDGTPVNAGEYCRPAPDPGGRTLLRPVPGQVMALLKQGASLVCNDLESLTPSLRALGSALRDAYSARVTARLYCSCRELQAFASHYDKNDVFAVQLEGETVWRLYSNRADYPVQHERYRQFTAAEHDWAKGPVAETTKMTAGDVLYIPRGFYHDAIASSQASLHLTFGVQGPIGHDFIQMLLEQAVSDPVFRRNFPRPSEGRDALREHLGILADRILEFALSEEILDAIEAYQSALRRTATPYSLPVHRNGEAQRAAETPPQNAEGH